MQSHDIEYWTAVKDTDQCLIHKTACEVVNHSDSILSKYMGPFIRHTIEKGGDEFLYIPFWDWVYGFCLAWPGVSVNQ